MKNEKEFSRFFRDQDKIKEKFHITTLEQIGEGCPDLLMTSRSTGTFLAELKVIKNKSCKLPFRKAQPQWISEHIASGGKVAIVVYIQETKEIAVCYAQKIRKLSTMAFSEFDDQCITEWLVQKDQASKWFIAHLVFFKCLYGWGRILD